MTRARRSVLGTVLAAATILTLAGCANDTSAVDHEVRRIPTPDGGTVLCVIIRDASAGSSSVDCGWTTRTIPARAAMNEDHA